MSIVGLTPCRVLRGILCSIPVALAFDFRGLCR